jgi:hypothetical protein
MPWPSHPSLDHSNYTWRRVQVISNGSTYYNINLQNSWAAYLKLASRDVSVRTLLFKHTHSP